MRIIAMTLVIWGMTVQLAMAAPPNTCVPEALPTLGGPSTSSSDINDDGDIVGTSTIVDAAGQTVGTHAFLWKRGRMQALENFPDTGVSVANGLNDAGTIVGAAFPGGMPGPIAVAWIRGTLVSLLLPDGAQGGAVAVNNRGQIVGNAGAAGDSRCLLWNHSRARPVDLGVSGFCQVRAINDHGVVVGSTTMPDGRGAGFQWHQGTVTILPAPTSIVHTAAVDVNAAGKIVGSASEVTNIAHASWWSPGLAPTILDRPGAATSVNDRGDVAVAVQSETGNGGLAWIDRNGTVHDLGAVDGAPVDFDINNRRQAVWSIATGQGIRSYTCRAGF